MQAGANARQKSGSKSKAAQAAPAEETLRATQVLGRRVIDGSNALILGYVDEIYFSFETRQWSPCACAPISKRGCSRC